MYDIQNYPEEYYQNYKPDYMDGLQHYLAFKFLIKSYQSAESGWHMNSVVLCHDLDKFK